MSSNFYGYRFEIEDYKKLAKNSTPFKAVGDLPKEDIPLEIDARKWHRIENQGPMGSCRGHSLSSVGEMAFFIATGEVVQFSPLYCYYATQKVDGLAGRDVGSTISGGVVVAKQGLCPLEVMPYPNPVRYRWELPQQAVDAAKDYVLEHSYEINSYEDAFKFLSSGQGGVDIGMLWNDRYMNPNSEGCVEDYAPGGGGHAVCFLGYTQRKDRYGRNYLLLPNSWGPQTYGKQGWAEVSPIAIDKIYKSQYTVSRGMSDMKSPKIRKIPEYGLF